jgi:hypothetical protein
MTGRNIKKEKWIPCTYQFEIQLKMFKIVFFVFRPLVDYYGPRRDLKNHTRGALTGHYWPPPGLTLFFPARAHRFKSIQTVRSHRHAVWKLSNTLLLVYHTHTLSHGHTHTHNVNPFNLSFVFCFVSFLLHSNDDWNEARNTRNIATMTTTTPPLGWENNTDTNQQLSGVVNKSRSVCGWGKGEKERQVVVGVRSTWMTANDCAATYLRSRLLFASEGWGRASFWRERYRYICMRVCVCVE